MKKEYGLYIHIPFCKSKCYYCDFYSKRYEEGIAEKYIDTLRKEVIYLNDKYNILDSNIVTIYIGGGTPSILTAEQILKLFNLIKNSFDLTLLKEITIEINPESIDEKKVLIIKNFVENLPKVNLRVSIGVQSFNNRILNNLGRVHKSDDVYKAVKVLNDFKIDNYNFDLIFGSPEQTLDNLKEDLEKALQISPKHISYYALTVEENTKLHSMKYSPDADLQSEMYNLITKVLNTNGFRHYEISNFAKPGYECLHNLNYWLYKEYIGLGSSAVSFMSNFRIKNSSDVEEYTKEEFRYFFEEITEDISLKEQIMLKLRTDFGIKKEEIIFKKYFDTFEKLIKEGKIISQGDTIKIHPKYRFLSNSIILEFFNF